MLSETRRMRSGQLHPSLHAFAAEVGAALTAIRATGEEVGFEVVEERERTHHPALYCYRPLTADFIARNWEQLRTTASARAAMSALAAIPGLQSYLAAYARSASDDGTCDLAEAALRCFAVRVYDGCDTVFELLPERFEPAYRELHENAVEQRTEVALLGLLRGVSTTSKEFSIAEGILLAPLARLGRVPPDPSWVRDKRRSVVVAIDPGDDPDGVEHALQRMRDLQTTLRLYAGGISLAPLAWIHGETSEWRALPLRGGGRTDGKVALVPEQEPELQAFYALVGRRRPTEGEVAWALERFELGCEQEERVTGLTDHLLALRALLEPEGARSGRLAGRVAALCGEDAERPAITASITRAISLERTAMNGAPLARDAVALASEVEDRLRALLRDVICGHLRGELDALADSLIDPAEPPVTEPPPAAPEFRVSRRARPSRFAADLFATPKPPSHPAPAPRAGVSESYDDAPSRAHAVFDAPTSELPVVARTGG